MPAKPNYEILSQVGKILPDATVQHTNNTVIISAPDEATFKDWKAKLEAENLVCHTHERLEHTIVVSMWPLRQIFIESKASKPTT